jgi:PAS domain S-box-containing protein
MPGRDSQRDGVGRLFTSDVFIFEDPIRIRRTLWVIIAVLLAGASSIAVFAWAIGWMETFRTAVAATIAFLAVALVLRAGLTRLAGIVTLLSLLAAVNYGIATGDGIHDVAIIVYPAVIIIGSLLLNTGSFIILTLLVMTSVVAIGAMEIQGVIATKFGGQYKYPDVFIALVILAAEAVVIRKLTSIITSSLERARSSERNYREIFNATSESILVHDAETIEILDANSASVRMFGHNRQDLFGKTPDFITAHDHPISDELKQEMVKRAFDEGVHVFEWRLRHKDGTEFWAEVTLRAAKIGGAMRLLAVLRDVDARKRMEERLRQSEKLEAVGQLAGGIAHDFNNQLAGIVGYADLVRTDIDDDSPLASSVDRILVAARRAADLTSKLLAFARRGKNESAAVDIHVLVEEVMALLSRSVNKLIAFERRLEAEASHALGDPSQLQSAILNLALNARDAMPDGGTLTVATRIVPISTGDGPDDGGILPPGDYLEVEVSDTGVGMDQETRRRIFEPFFTTKSKGKGTGMGLAAVYGTVRNHGGSIDVYSESGRGSTFRMLLPLYDGPLIPEESAAPQVESARGTARILIVDDEKAVGGVASRMVEQLGYTAVVRYDGVAATEFYQDSWRDIDLVVLDMSMPRMGGRETFAAMRRINPDAVVLLTSGFSINDEVQALLDSGAYGFIQKPFWQKDFTRTVVETLQDAARRGPGPQET